METLSNRKIIDAVVEGRVFNCSMKTGKVVKHTSFRPESESNYLQDTGVKLQRTRLATDLRLMRNKGWNIKIEDKKIIPLKRKENESSENIGKNNN